MIILPGEVEDSIGEIKSDVKRPDYGVVNTQYDIHLLHYKIVQLKPI